MDGNRKTAYYTLLRLTKNTSYSNIELNNQIARWKPDSPSFVRDLVYGVLEQNMYLDYLLDQLVRSGVRKLNPEPHVLLRMGAYQLLFMDSVPEYAAVNETVNMAKKFCYHQSKMVNGVLRNLMRKLDTLKEPEDEKDPVKRLSLTYSYDSWITELWLSQYGEKQAESMMEAGNLTPPFTVRVNTLKITAEELKQRLTDQGLVADHHPFVQDVMTISGHEVLNTEEYAEGLFSVQDAGAVQSILALDPKPGATVIDVCAAPGGKSFVSAQNMQNQGVIYSFDVFENKIEMLQQQAKRLGITCIQASIHNGEELRQDLVGIADNVICDVPCTGLGVVRRKPEIKYRKVQDQGRALAEKQLRILEIAEQYLKPEGYLVYSTCTINEIENSKVIETFLKRHSNFRLLESRQLLPNTDGTDGFYFAKLKKN